MNRNHSFCLLSQYFFKKYQMDQNTYTIKYWPWCKYCTNYNVIVNRGHCFVSVNRIYSLTVEKVEKIFLALSASELKQNRALCEGVSDGFNFVLMCHAQRAVSTNYFLYHLNGGQLGKMTPDHIHLMSDCPLGSRPDTKYLLCLPSVWYQFLRVEASCGPGSYRLRHSGWPGRLQGPSYHRVSHLKGTFKSSE